MTADPRRFPSVNASLANETHNKSAAVPIDLALYSKLAFLIFFDSRISQPSGPPALSKQIMPGMRAKLRGFHTLHMLPLTPDLAAHIFETKH